MSQTEQRHEVTADMSNMHERRTEPANSMIKSLIALGGLPIRSRDKRFTFAAELASGDRVYVIPLEGAPEPFEKVNAVLTLRKRDIADFIDKVELGADEFSFDGFIFELDGMDERAILAKKISIHPDKGMSVSIDMTLGRYTQFTLTEKNATPVEALTVKSEWLCALEQMREERATRKRKM